MTHFMHKIMDILAQNPQVPVFKRFIGSDEALSWTTVTWADYKDDLIRAASVCRRVLAAEGIKNGDVVGLWFVALSHLGNFHRSNILHFSPEGSLGTNIATLSTFMPYQPLALYPRYSARGTSHRASLLSAICSKHAMGRHYSLTQNISIMPQVSVFPLA